MDLNTDEYIYSCKAGKFIDIRYKVNDVLNCQCKYCIFTINCDIYKRITQSDFENFMDDCEDESDLDYNGLRADYDALHSLYKKLEKKLDSLINKGLEVNNIVNCDLINLRINKLSDRIKLIEKD